MKIGAFSYASARNASSSAPARFGESPDQDVSFRALMNAAKEQRFRSERKALHAQRELSAPRARLPDDNARAEHDGAFDSELAPTQLLPLMIPSASHTPALRPDAPMASPDAETEAMLYAPHDHAIAGPPQTQTPTAADVSFVAHAHEERLLNASAIHDAREWRPVLAHSDAHQLSADQIADERAFRLDELGPFGRAEAVAMGAPDGLTAHAAWPPAPPVARAIGTTSRSSSQQDRAHPAPQPHQGPAPAERQIRHKLRMLPRPAQRARADGVPFTAFASATLASTQRVRSHGARAQTRRADPPPFDIRVTQRAHAPGAEINLTLIDGDYGAEIVAAADLTPAEQSLFRRAVSRLMGRHARALRAVWINGVQEAPHSFTTQGASHGHRRG